ncbi:LOW QUALITY PROTEIN: hypothetical protein KUTeg_022759 [Tegillarca granosa]|uniref:Uncharacterized protein n=1 Tax=Tegillarca granosa TaxID=220873 RepID=A0ABQ9DZM2_TEGGR|nr:LOW QUALITY PROTEIN: hypothetical protein KUTeg_022759 [Tegillarca granosa]
MFCRKNLCQLDTIRAVNGRKIVDCNRYVFCYLFVRTMTISYLLQIAISGKICISFFLFYFITCICYFKS